MSTAIVPINLEETMQLGSLLAQSGFFADSRQAAQAVVKVLAGRELGFGPIASMTGVNIINGKVALSANLMAAAIKRSGHYNYRVVKLDDKQCTLDFTEAGQAIGTSTFTMEDAKLAKLDGPNWTKFPRNMLFARALSNGVKWYCPDLAGGPLYTPDELGASIDGETGEIVEGVITPPVVSQESAQPEPPAPVGPPMTEGQRKRLHGLGSTAYGPDWDAKRHDLVRYITKGRSESSTDLTEAEAATLISGIERKLNAPTNGKPGADFPAAADLHPQSTFVTPEP